MPNPMMVFANDDASQIFDQHFALKCPHCGVLSNVTAVSVPRYPYLKRFNPPRVGIVYRCDSCNGPIPLFFPSIHDQGNARFLIATNYEEVLRTSEDFEFTYLPATILPDFKEALACYSSGCFNAFAAMCRRTVQAVSVDLGANGSDKVLGQLKDLKEMAQIDDELFVVLKQIVLDGHDGAHPHLPALSAERAEILLELMKDVMYQLYVRKGKLQEAANLRSAARK